MPGNGFKFDCPGCPARHEITTGADNYGEGPFSFEQFVCPRCERLQSVAVSDGDDPETFKCDRCGGPLESWAGRVWFEGPPGMNSEERIVGPCPKCGTTFDKRDFVKHGATFVLWD